MTPDKAERIAAMRMREPADLPAMPAVAAVVDRWEAACRRELAAVESELTRLLHHRAELRGRLRDLHVARHGTGAVRIDGRLVRYRWPPAWTGPVLPPPGTRPLAGCALRRALVDLLVTARRPLATADLLHLLRLVDMEPAGPPLKRISDALRRESLQGGVVRVARGRYQAAAG